MSVYTKSRVVIFIHNSKTLVKEFNRVMLGG